MKRLHRIFANGNMALKEFLDEHCIAHEYEESILGRTVFLLISVTDLNWSKLASHLAYNSDVFHTTELSFSRKDILQADCCTLGVISHFGYPQPEDGSQRATYRNGSGCTSCGVGWAQEAPFRFLKKPTQKRSSALQLNWVFDEIFFPRQARDQLNRAGFTGFRFQSPVLHKSGEPVQDWFQMQVYDVSRPVVNTATLKSELCPDCGNTKYNHPQGEMLRLTNPFISTDLDVIKSDEWFGSGGSAYRLLFLSPRIAKFVIDNKWRGVALTPCQLLDAPSTA